MLLLVDNETVIELAVLVAGEEAGKIMKLLLRKPGITDEDLSRSLQMDIREVRRILHRLNEQGILHYELTRDKETGHRIFKWYVGQEQVIGYIITNMNKILDRLRERLEYEKTHQFFWCGSPGHPKLVFEDAMEKLFRCPTCGSPLQPYDNSELIEALEWKIGQISRYLEQLEKVRKVEAEQQEQPKKSKKKG